MALSAFSLRLLAMVLMPLDHMWATVIPGNDWMTWLGRLAFPIFAFLLAEGYRHTSDFKKYLKRMALFAVISEIPFNLMAYGMPLFPFHQNVLWTFCIALICMNALERLKVKGKPWLTWVLSPLVVFAGYLAGLILMVDYGGWGVIMVLVFYFLPGKSWPQRIAQLVLLYCINWRWMGGTVLPIGNFELPVQGFAVLALPFIWLYRGRQGLHTPLAKRLGYWFYPVHCLILGLLYL